jgi:hypothetical protein
MNIDDAKKIAEALKELLDIVVGFVNQRREALGEDGLKECGEFLPAIRELKEEYITKGVFSNEGLLGLQTFFNRVESVMKSAHAKDLARYNELLKQVKAALPQDAE